MEEIWRFGKSWKSWHGEWHKTYRIRVARGRLDGIEVKLWDLQFTSEIAPGMEMLFAWQTHGLGQSWSGLCWSSFLSRPVTTPLAICWSPSSGNNLLLICKLPHVGNVRVMKKKRVVRSTVLTWILIMTKLFSQLLLYGTSTNFVSRKAWTAVITWFLTFFSVC